MPERVVPLISVPNLRRFLRLLGALNVSYVVGIVAGLAVMYAVYAPSRYRDSRSLIDGGWEDLKRVASLAAPYYVLIVGALAWALTGRRKPDAFAVGSFVAVGLILAGETKVSAPALVSCLTICLAASFAALGLVRAGVCHA